MLRDLTDDGTGPLVITEAHRHQAGWVFHYQSQAFLRSGEETDRFVDLGPIVVGARSKGVFLAAGADITLGAGPRVVDET